VDTTTFKISPDILSIWKNELDTILFDIPELQKAKKFKRKENFYHYTNLAGLKAIVEKQCLFASNSAFLNDKEEFYFGIKLFCDTICLLEIEKEFISHKKLFETMKSLLNLKKSNRYVTCFSSDGDLLSQWRAYADDGKGIAIGFDSKQLVEAFKIKADGLFIIYDSEVQKKISDIILRKCAKFYIEKKNQFDWGGDDAFDKFVSEEIIFFINRYVGQFKHNAFNEEKEFRFDMAIDDEINKDRELLYRVGKNNLLVPHLFLKTNYLDEKEQRSKTQQGLEELENEKQFKIKRLPINSIIIGPSMNFELNQQAIGDFLKKHGYENVNIKESNVPYRI